MTNSHWLRETFTKETIIHSPNTYLLDQYKLFVSVGVEPVVPSVMTVFQQLYLDIIILNKIYYSYAFEYIQYMYISRDGNFIGLTTPYLKQSQDFDMLHLVFYF